VGSDLQTAPGEEFIMKAMLARFIREESGEDLIEYGLLAAFVAAVALAVIIGNPGIRDGLKNAFKKAVDALDQAGQ
jgi:Flp pilus assembly pilin Flp